jgi:hypothetical protein
LVPCTDWSNEQLENNAAELQSLLGNFYLRITSAAIRSRLPEGFNSHHREALQQSLNSQDLSDVANPLQNLASVVDNHLSQLCVSDALEAIIQQLKAVCLAPDTDVPLLIFHFFVGQCDDERDGAMGPEHTRVYDRESICNLS